MRLLSALLLSALIAPPLLAQAYGPPIPKQEIHASDVVGRYNGTQTEIAAALELLANGRFRYALSYGALDERAEGKWEVDGQQILLTSDPLTPAKFSLLHEKPGPPRELKITLDLPEGLSRQYFSAVVVLKSGHVLQRQLSDNGLTVDFEPSDPPVSVALALPIYELHSDIVPVSNHDGREIAFRFDPNDLDKAAFNRTALSVEKGELLLKRHDRTIYFRR